MLSFKVGKGAEAPAAKLTQAQQKLVDIDHYSHDIHYSDRYSDDVSEYRHVSLPEGLRKYLPSPLRLMTEAEWRGLGVQQSQGWVHYMIHEPEPHVLLFKREKNYQLKYPRGAPAPALKLHKQ
ncbi:hypothetical protein IWQ56_000346 [Coemansia nantahalensis]|uniref:Uncharacterized protein n=1 Tax=Coemansia nantahalensis TaxID=2789366 RepID=A0ACC1K1C6_9FUNG|nr:hypothetical protein IWQ57_002331 [Coemansia nantahalensis]KAJ2774939.1 hypothetical protein IWQ56_000346 [Coemansia nantahalensis]